MCGIYCAIHSGNALSPNEGLRARLKNRGPDSDKHQCYDLPNGFYVSLYSTVLSLRGDKVVEQPVVGRDLVLCWNGEAWTIDGKRAKGCDTSAVLDHLAEVGKISSSHVASRDESLRLRAEILVALLSQIAGPYAFVLYDKENHVLYFGRDFLGRRSLLKCVDQETGLILSSISNSEGDMSWDEVDADGVYYHDLLSLNNVSFSQSRPGLCRVPYLFLDRSSSTCNRSVIPRLSLNITIPESSPPLEKASTSVLELEDLLVRSVEVRIADIPVPAENSTQQNPNNTLPVSRLAILFSGGLDCTVLARICHDRLPPNESIDLLNVAFHNPRVHGVAESDSRAATEIYETCPDRITGRRSLRELQEVCPTREWRFVAINVPYSESQAHRSEVVSLMRPHRTEMDLSICLALYFASRGAGILRDTLNGGEVPYTSSARVMLSGLGADELFGGYTRHATAFQRKGIQGLIDELALDLSRLGTRNLGRDDRVLSHWGKETRFPFLDENLVHWAVSVPIQAKYGIDDVSTDTRDADIEPGKRVLRYLAIRLGMHHVAREKKRAVSQEGMCI